MGARSAKGSEMAGGGDVRGQCSRSRLGSSLSGFPGTRFPAGGLKNGEWQPIVQIGTSLT